MDKLRALKTGLSFIQRTSAKTLKSENIQYVSKDVEKTLGCTDEFVKKADSTKTVTDVAQQVKKEPINITDADKEFFHAYIQMKRIEYPITKADVEYLSRFEGKEFINNSIDLIMGKLKIPKSLKPGIVEYSMNEETFMAYSYNANLLLLNPNSSIKTKAELFGFISHELRHMTQNFDVLRTEGLGEKAVRALAIKTAKEQIANLKQTIKKCSVEEYKQMVPDEQAQKEFEYLKKLRKINCEEYEKNMIALLRQLKEINIQNLDNTRKTIISEMGVLKSDSEQGKRAKKYLKSILTNYIKSDGTADACKYNLTVTEREALNLGFINEEKFKAKGDLKECFIKFLKNFKPKKTDNAERKKELEKEISELHEQVQKMGMKEYLRYIYG